MDKGSINIGSAIERAVAEEVSRQFAATLARIRDDVEKYAPKELWNPVRLYSVASVAALLEVGKGWVYERINNGELPVVELGSTRSKQRIRANDLLAFIDTRSFGHTSGSQVAEPLVCDPLK